MAAPSQERRGRATKAEALYLPANPAIRAFINELHFARGRSPRTCAA